MCGCKSEHTPGQAVHGNKKDVALDVHVDLLGGSDSCEREVKALVLNKSAGEGVFHAAVLHSWNGYHKLIRDSHSALALDLREQGRGHFEPVLIIKVDDS